MKKFLSLVLALVMTMSLVTVSAGAKDFTDDSSITYKEAVDVISALGVVDGYSGGDFRPDDVLTRGAAAKIICNLILGPTTASALSAGTAPFKDVPVTNTFAGYITYCSQQGIISGYADGTFRPTGTLSGNAFMKMLLGALGYDSSIEGYTGANWTVSVIKQAVGIGLDDGNDEFVGSKAVTRQEAALYAFNMLQATMVEYDQQNTIVVGDITINTTSSRSDVENSGKSDKYINSDGKMQFAEKYFTDLRLDDSGEDDFARPSNVWTLKSDEIGTYAKEADATYTASVEVGDIYKDLGLNKTVDKDDVSVYVDGVVNTKVASPVAIKKGDDDNKFGANGVLTEVFYDDDDGTVTITEVNTYVGQVSKNVAATSKKDAYVVVATLDAAPSETGNLEFETNEEFEEDAYVLFTYSEAAEEVKSVAAAEEVSGTVTKVVNKASDDENKGLTIADTEYKTSKMVSGELLGDVSVKNDYTVYLDAYGYGLALPGNHTFLNSINNEIMRLKTTGELDDILDQWIPKESVPSELFSRYVFLLGCLCAVAVLILAIVIQINRYLKAQIDAKTKSLQILNHDLEEQIANVRQSNELKTLLIENNVEGVVIVTRENRISLFNEAAQRITGLKESPVGRILFDIPLFRKMLNPTEEGFPETAQKTNKLVRIMDSSDRIRFFRYNLFPLFAEEQEVQGLTLIFNDVTEQIRLENVAFEREKSRSIDRVVAGIAHEIRNPLTAIKTFAELLPAKNTDQEFQQEFSAIVPAEIQRFNQLITDLLEYAQPVRMTAQPVEAAELVYSTASLMQYNFAQKNVKIAASAEKGVYILANKQQLKQILINFLLNGFEAILEKQQPDNRTISITMSARDETVTFLVEDHGIGMTEQQIKNAREPFYSTKRNGTGLGLYIAQRYAQRNGGELYIESRKDMYTKIYLQFKQYYLQ